jgi:hypothetical protein
MDDLDKYIDDLFRQKLSDAGASVSTSGNDWTQLSKTIQRKNFLRFNPGSFNIFYLAASAVIITTLCAIVVPGIVNKHDGKKQIPEQSIPVVDSLSVIDTINIKEDTIAIKPEIPNKECSQNHKSIELSTDEKVGLSNSINSKSVSNENNIALTVPQKDSVENISSREHEQIVPAVIEQPVRTDTIVKIDTIRIQKKGVQFKRKKSLL